VIGRVPVRGTRLAARLGLPVASRVLKRPLSVYLNPNLTRTSPTRQLVRTVEDPHPRINRQLGQWIRTRDLRLGDILVAEALARFERPLLVIAGSGDRICPAEAALAAVPVAKGPVRSLVVGDATRPVAHADLFIADLVHELVFPPVTQWLLAES
jgi:pimeloyl-ACP methyl ester carboxylesterase